MQPLLDFPKLHCPFVRKTYEANVDDWRQYGRALEMRAPNVRIVLDQINPGYEWVFNDPNTFAVEKLNGTNVQLVVEKGRLVYIQNRAGNIIDPLQVIAGKTFIIEGIFMAIQKGYIKGDGVYEGEVIGPKLQGNPYDLTYHLFYPFIKTVMDLVYNSFREHEVTYANLSSWFKDWLFSRYYNKLQPPAADKKKIFAEGVIFYNMQRKAQGLVYMAKLRRNMFDWYYSDKIRIGKEIPDNNQGHSLDDNA